MTMSFKFKRTLLGILTAGALSITIYAILSLFIPLNTSIEWHFHILGPTPLKIILIINPVSLFCSFAAFFISLNTIILSKLYTKNNLFLNRFTIFVILTVISINILIFIPHFMALLLCWNRLGLTSLILIIYHQNPDSLEEGISYILTLREPLIILVSISVVILNIDATSVPINIEIPALTIDRTNSRRESTYRQEIPVSGTNISSTNISLPNSSNPILPKNFNDGCIRIKPAERGWFPPRLSHLPWQAIEWDGGNNIKYQGCIPSECPLSTEEFKKATRYFWPNGQCRSRAFSYITLDAETQTDSTSYPSQEKHLPKKYIIKKCKHIISIPELEILQTPSYLSFTEIYQRGVSLNSASGGNPDTDTLQVVPSKSGWFPLETAHLEGKAFEWSDNNKVKFQGWIGSSCTHSTEEYKKSIELYNPRGTNWSATLPSFQFSATKKSVFTQTLAASFIPDIKIHGESENIYMDIGQLGICNTKL
jgi:hypothetical protein